MTTRIVPHPDTEHITVHVLPDDIDDERALALLARYVEAIESGEHPPFPYIAAVFSEIYAIGMARRAEGGA